MYFTGYEDKCIQLDPVKEPSNFITDETDLKVTTQADDGTYKIQNIKRK